MKTMTVTLEIETEDCTVRDLKEWATECGGVFDVSFPDAETKTFRVKQVSVQVADQTKPKAKRPARKAR